MAAFSLSKLIKKNGALASILGSLPGVGGNFGILDAAGGLVWGSPAQQGASRAAVELDGQTIGWVAGGQNPDALAALLTYAAGQEQEKKTLASELLERYRELNLLYRLAEILGASPHPGAIAAAALAEAAHIIPAEAGLVLLRSDGKEAQRAGGKEALRAGGKEVLQPAAAWGSPLSLAPGCPLVEGVLASGQPALGNAIPGEACFNGSDIGLVSAACAPLKTEKTTLGVIVLAAAPERAFSAGELKLLNAIAQQTAPLIEVSRLYQVELEKARFERELQMARQVQESLLPQRMPAVPGWQFERRWSPARDVSGDFYDVIEEGPQRLGLVIADITDKGLPASLFMVFVRSALRASITRSAPPERAMINANRVICEDSYEGLFATLLYGRLNTASGELAYVNAGHPPALLYRRAQDDIQLLERTGMALGVDDGVNYTQRSARLEPGDFLLFYTDGVIEATGPQRQEFGLERLKAEVYRLRASSAAGLLDGLEQALADYTAPLPAEDDVTLMVVKRM